MLCAGLSLVNKGGFAWPSGHKLSEQAVAVLSSRAEQTTTTKKSFVNLNVPFIPEVADGRWLPPWSNACEEASIIMVEQSYLGVAPRNRTEEQNLMLPLFDWEVKEFGSHSDTDAARTARIINEFSSFEATVVTEPNLEVIKAELAAGRPVFSFHYGYGLNNPLLRFRRGGSSYHVSVLVGYDEAKKEFLMNDTGQPKGLDWRYTYATILSTLHDFDHKRHAADGPPVVLFTRPKQLVRAPGSGRIYLVQDGAKRRVLSPAVFKKYRISWAAVKTISPEELTALPDGEVFK